MPAGGPWPEPHGGPERRRRALLSLFFLLHWGAVGAYVLPATRAALDPLPDWLRPAAALVFPRAVNAVWPVTVPYLDLTATRQHWTLFAPRPADWVPSIDVVVYFPVADPGRDPGAEGAEGDAWVGDTLRLHGPREVSYPHLLHHRSYRILFNLGYEEWGAGYRPLFAREMCRTLRDAGGRAPGGVALSATWQPIRIPWEEDDREAYRQWLGGFDCRVEDGGARERAPWRVYGLPDPLDTSGWARVGRSSTGEGAEEPARRDAAR